MIIGDTRPTPPPLSAKLNQAELKLSCAEYIHFLTTTTTTTHHHHPQELLMHFQASYKANFWYAT